MISKPFAYICLILLLGSSIFILNYAPQHGEEATIVGEIWVPVAGAATELDASNLPVEYSRDVRVATNKTTANQILAVPGVHYNWNAATGVVSTINVANSPLLNSHASNFTIDYQYHVMSDTNTLTSNLLNLAFGKVGIGIVLMATVLLIFSGLKGRLL
tara:strand:+ start:1550 stop:2026 length:477 start_codon:yes stop_codon:yes gene_type:complete